eukprot:7975821-Pyramimonas_sp.AAC.1
MFDLTESESESEASDPSKAMCDEQPRFEPVNTEQEEYTLVYKPFLLHLPPAAAAANCQNRRGHWTQRGQSLKRWHFVPILVTLTPVNTDCPVDPDKLGDRRGTYAINVRH